LLGAWQTDGNRTSSFMTQKRSEKFMHNREMVVKLQNAHADHIESIYRQLMGLPGNPHGIEILNIGATKVFLSNQNRLENRAIFTGNETLPELREVTACFERKGVDGFFEINPANFYRSDPFSWESEMLPALIELGYHPGLLRCVWYLAECPNYDRRGDNISIKQFTFDQADEFIADKLIVEPVKPEKIENEMQEIKHNFTKAWVHFIGYEGGKPASISKLFIKNKMAYLAWGFTAQEFRRKGHHRVHVMTRVRSAFEAGCDIVFSVTDFNIPSSLSLQKAGFNLAYNYLLMEKPARAQ
jgi:hypothetical protein